MVITRVAGEKGEKELGKSDSGDQGNRRDNLRGEDRYMTPNLKVIKGNDHIHTVRSSER
jgi:hypothetical protein